MASNLYYSLQNPRQLVISYVFRCLEDYTRLKYEQPLYKQNINLYRLSIACPRGLVQYLFIQSKYQLYILYITISFHTGEPKGLNLILPECFEDNEISPVKNYFGGKEGTGKYTWFRNKEKLDNTECDLVAASSEVVGETL
jgi:hypothetical protein